MKLLIIRFSSIGDIVLTTPIIRCLKQQLANVEIHYLTKHEYAIMLSANPYIQNTYSIHQSIKEVLPKLASEKYDAIIDLHDNIRSHQICKQLKIKRIFRYNKQRFKRMLLTTFKINLLNNHIVDRYFDAVSQLNIINDGKGLDYFITESDELNITQLPFTHIAGYGVVVVGAKHITKTIPLEKLKELCNTITIPIILIGGTDDAYNGFQLAEIDNFKIFNACGKYNINQSAAIIKKAKWVITPDTGMMHIAACFNKRIISVWGATDKRLGFAPYQNANNTTYIEHNNLSCRPCHKHGSNACPKKHFKCMQELDMQQIIALL